MRPKFLNVIRPLEDYIDPETGQVRWFDDDGDYIEKGWDETKHPRGQPGNAGQFGAGGGGKKPGAPKPKGKGEEEPAWMRRGQVWGAKPKPKAEPAPKPAPKPPAPKPAPKPPAPKPAPKPEPVPNFPIQDEVVGKPKAEGNPQPKAGWDKNFHGDRDWDKELADKFLRQMGRGKLDWKKDGEDMVAAIAGGQLRAHPGGIVDNWKVGFFDKDGVQLRHVKWGISPTAGANELWTRVGQRDVRGDFAGAETQARVKEKKRQQDEAEVKAFEAQRAAREKQREAEEQERMARVAAMNKPVRPPESQPVPYTPGKEYKIGSTALTAPDKKRGIKLVEENDLESQIPNPKRGITPSYIGKIAGDGKCIIKPAAACAGGPPEEVNAFDISEALGFGVVPITRYRTFEVKEPDQERYAGLKSSAMAWMDNACMPDEIAEFGPNDHTRDTWSQMTCMDILTGNWDRHGRNYMMDKATKAIIAIDNGASCGDGRFSEGKAENSWSQIRGPGQSRTPQLKRAHFERVKAFANSPEFVEVLSRHFNQGTVEQQVRKAKDSVATFERDLKDWIV
jgi:hypothetical protein